MFDQEREKIIGCLSVLLIVSHIVILGIFFRATIFEWGSILLVIYLMVAATWYFKKKGNILKRNRDLMDESNEVRESVKEYLLEESGLIPTYQYITPAGCAFIQIDSSQQKVRIGGLYTKTNRITSKIVDKKEITGVSVTENGNRIMGSDLASSQTTGFLESIRFGGTGTIIDSLEKQRGKKRISDISLVLTLNDLLEPSISLNFISHSLVKGSQEHFEALTEAQRWMDKVNKLLSQKD